ncbi:unnamed protein product, partial [Rotaria sordida]
FIWWIIFLYKINQQVITFRIVNNEFLKKELTTEDFPGARKYARNWTSGDTVGHGVFTYEDGGRYEGNFKRRAGREGNGTFYFADGRKYVGSWMNNQPNGQGIFTWPDGNRYEGSFKDGKMHGNGVLYYTDGRKYIGIFVLSRCIHIGLDLYHYSFHQVEKAPGEPTLNIQDIIDNTQRPVREIMKLESITGEQGMLKCDCKQGCKTNKCKCKQANVLCNSRCHHALSCCNKRF